MRMGTGGSLFLPMNLVLTSTVAEYLMVLHNLRQSHIISYTEETNVEGPPHAQMWTCWINGTGTWPSRFHDRRILTNSGT